MEDNFITVSRLMLEHIREHRPEFSPVRYAILSQLALESGWGKSGLAKHFNNFAGLKAREDLILPPGVNVGFVDYRDWKEQRTGKTEGKKDLDLRVFDLEHFPAVYFAFLDRKHYEGKEQYLSTERQYIAFLLSRDYCTDFPGALSVAESKLLYAAKIDEIRHGRTLANLLDIIEPPDWV